MPGPAARVGDMTAHGGAIVGPGVPNVLVGGMPASVLGDMHVCPMVTPGVPPIPHVGGPISMPGAPTVLIMGRPATTQGCICVCVGPPDTIPMGLPTVQFGTAGSGSGAAGSAGGAGAGGANASANSATVANVESWTKEEHWAEIQFVDKAGLPVSGIAYVFKDPSGKESEGMLRMDGTIRRDALEKEGSCEVTLIGVGEAKWDKNKANVGDKVKMSAKADGFENGTKALIQVYKRDIKGPDTVVAVVETKVQGNKVEGEWTYELPEPEEGVLIPPEGAMASPDDPKGYSSPDFYFEVIVGVCVTRSQLFNCEDFIEVIVKDENGQPLKDEDYILYLSSGETRTGKLDGSGKLREEGVPPGLNKLRLPGLPEFEADV